MTAAPRPDPRAFRQRLLAREPLIGVFMKSPGPHNTEIIGGLGYDFVMLDEEHAPWDRVTLDVGLLAARAVGTAGLVRIARPDPSNILSVLDDARRLQGHCRRFGRGCGVLQEGGTCVCTCASCVK